MDFFEIEHSDLTSIKVIGVGGGGGNAVDNMISSIIKGVQFVAANTDHQALKRSKAQHKVQLGMKLTKGLGAGANPDVGREAALESYEEIRELVRGCELIFVTAGMGGGTGTGAAPIIAQIAKEENALTVGVVTKPFYFEGKKRREQAEHGIAEFRTHVDSLITIPNDRLLSFAPKKATFIDMLKKADEVLYYAVKGISDLIVVPGLINLDFADLRTVMSEKGLAMMGSGTASGEARAREASAKAVSSPLLEDISISGARGVLINITCDPDMTIDEVHEAAGAIQEAAHEDAEIIFGTVFDMDAGGEIRITVIATGIDSNAAMKFMPLENELARSGKVTMLNAPRTTRPTKLLPQTIPARHVGSRPLRTQPPSTISEDDWNIPAYLRSERARKQVEHNSTANRLGPQTQNARYVPSKENFVIDEDEFEIPSFIRKLAD
ncbi:cell division protein FtsZ [Desulfovibrionales bacterium]